MKKLSIRLRNQKLTIESLEALKEYFNLTSAEIEIFKETYDSSKQLTQKERLLDAMRFLEGIPNDFCIQLDPHSFKGDGSLSYEIFKK